MKQIYRFKISVKATPKCDVRQLVSIPYSDQVLCQTDLYIQLRYLKQLQYRIVSYFTETEFMDIDQFEKEVGHVF